MYSREEEQHGSNGSKTQVLVDDMNSNQHTFTLLLQIHLPNSNEHRGDASWSRKIPSQAKIWQLLRLWISNKSVSSKMAQTV